VIVYDTTSRDAYGAPQHLFAQVLDKAEISFVIHHLVHGLFGHTEQRERRCFVDQNCCGCACMVYNKAETNVFIAFIGTMVCTTPLAQNATAFCTAKDES
jgi:hypothetical protein